MKLQLDFHKFDHVMFWAACCLAFFGFLRCLEFTVTSAGFQSDVLLTPRDILVDKKPFPDSLVVKLKKSKTDQFKRGFSVVLARLDSQICPVSALLAYLHLQGPSQGPLFLFQNGIVLTRVKFSNWFMKLYLQPVRLAISLLIVFRLVLPPQQPPWVCQITLLKLWVDGIAMHIYCMSHHQVSTVSRLMALSQPFSPGL